MGCGDEAAPATEKDAGHEPHTKDAGDAKDAGDTSDAGDAGQGKHLVVVRVLGDGHGRVSGDHMLDCDDQAGGRCYAVVEHGALLHLEASADAGSTQLAWRPTSCGSDPACDLKVDEDITVDVIFTLVKNDSVALSVITSGTGAGEVTSTPQGLECEDA